MYYHINGHIFKPAFTDVAIQDLKGSLPPYQVMACLVSVHAYPDKVCPGISKRLLPIGSQRTVKKSDFMSKIVQIVQGVCLIPPQNGLSSFKINESGTCFISGRQFFFYLPKGLHSCACVYRRGTMPACQIAAVRNGNHGLKRPMAP